MHQVLVTALRIANFVERGKLNFNLTEKRAYRHHDKELSPVL
jgi:hypothetical protein